MSVTVTCVFVQGNRRGSARLALLQAGAANALLCLSVVQTLPGSCDSVGLGVAFVQREGGRGRVWMPRDRWLGGY